MTIKLRSPIPRKRSRLHAPPAYHFAEAIFLPEHSATKISFARVAARRRSSRDFGDGLNAAQLGKLLSLAVRSREAKPLDGHSDWESRPYPSAGGCHEIDILALNVSGHPDAAFVYDARHHALGMLASVPAATIRQLLGQVREVVPMGDATVLWFIADSAKLAARYRFFESLMWRDCGAVLASLSFAAAALNYSGCPIGIHAPPAMKLILRGYPSIHGIGGFVVARPAPSQRR